MSIEQRQANRIVCPKCGGPAVFKGGTSGPAGFRVLTWEATCKKHDCPWRMAVPGGLNEREARAAIRGAP